MQSKQCLKLQHIIHYIIFTIIVNFIIHFNLKQSNMRDVSRECSAETGIACSAETPRNRTNMRDVSRETYLLFNAFINGGICHFSHLDLIAISLSSSGFTHTSTNPNPNPNRLRWGRILVGPERTGWLTKQGEYIKTWRRRWFVLKQGKLFWFKESMITRASKPRGVIDVAKCLTVKGAKDALNKQYAFELSTRSETMYFIADSDKEKEDWINSIGRSVVQHSTSVTDSEIVDYDSKR